MSLVDENTLVLTLAHPAALEDDAKLLRQMKSYGAVTAAIGDGVAAAMPDADYTLELGCGYNAQQNAALIGFIGQFWATTLPKKRTSTPTAPPPDPGHRAGRQVKPFLFSS